MAKNSKLYFGIDLGGTNIQAAIYDPTDNKVVVRDGTKTKAKDGADAVLGRIEKLCNKLIDQAKLKPEDISGLGIGAPGAIDIETGVVLRAPNLGWDKFPLRDELSKRFAFDVTVDNDVNVGAWGEYKAGAGKGHDEQMAIFVGTGVGAGLVLGGKIYHGTNHTAGEIGHTVIAGRGALGHRTVEDMASRTNIVRNLQHLIESNYDSIVPELVDGDLSKIRSKILAQAFEKDDALAVEVITDAARYVGMAIANAVTLLSLPCVVVGGGATEALGKPWMKLIRASFEKHVFPAALRDTAIVPSALEDNAGPIGAALLAAERLG
ncbi:MAG: ROK family protein [Phycisphaeraceae bacterium]